MEIVTKQQIVSKRLLNISSSDRIGGTTSDFVVSLGSLIGQPKGISLYSVEINNSFYNIHEYNNKLSLKLGQSPNLNPATATSGYYNTEGGTAGFVYEFDVVITPGQYSIDELLVEVNSQLNTMVTTRGYDSFTNQTFKLGTSNRFQFMWRMIGSTSEQLVDVVLPSDYFYTHISLGAALTAAIKSQTIGIEIYQLNYESTLSKMFFRVANGKSNYEFKLLPSSMVNMFRYTNFNWTGTTAGFLSNSLRPALSNVEFGFVLDTRLYKTKLILKTNGTTTTSNGIYATKNSLGDVLGFNGETWLTTGSVTPKLVDLRGNNVIYIWSNIATNSATGSNGNAIHLLGKIQIIEKLGNTIFYRQYSPELETFPIDYPISSVSISCRDGSGRLVTNGDLDWSLSVMCYY